MNRLLLFSLLFITVVLCIFLGFFAYFRFQESHIPSQTAFFSEADRLIASQEFVKASKLLEKADFDNSGLWLRTIKRTMALPPTLAISTLAKVSQKATHSLPGNEDFWAYRVLAALQLKDKKNASKWSQERLVSDQFYLLKVQALLESESAKEDPETMLVLSNDPQTYARIAELLNSDSLRLDAALLFAGRGEFASAASLLALMNKPDDFAEVKSEIAMDQKDYKTAQDNFDKMTRTSQKRPDLMEMRADMLYLEGDLPATKAWLAAILDLPDQTSWRAYSNAILIDPVAANRLNLYLDMRKKFPLTKALVMDFFPLIVKESEAEAKQLLSDYKNQEGVDPSVELLAHIYFPSEDEIQRRSKLWDLFNTSRNSLDVFQYLAWYLLSVDDMRGTQVALDIFEANNEPTYQSTFVRALFYGLLRTNDEQSIEEFDSILSSPWSDFVHYNLAILYLRRSEANKAIELLKPLEGSLAWGNDSSFRNTKEAQLKTTLGISYFLLGNVDFAKRYLDEALLVDPLNRRALFVRRVLL